MSVDAVADSAPAAPLLTRRELIVAGTLGASAMAAALIRPSADDSETSTLALDGLVPDRIGPWARSSAGGVLIPKGDDPGGKTYDDVLTRYYVSEAAAPIMLLIAYGSAQTGNTELHRPEVCYPAAGFRVRTWPEMSLRLLGAPVKARPITALASGRIEQMLYWSRVGKDFPTSSLEQRWAVLRHTIRGSVPDGILVRISTIDANRGRALEALRAFAVALISSGSPQMRHLLIGRA